MDPNAAQPPQPAIHTETPAPQTAAENKPFSPWAYIALLFAALWIGTLVIFVTSQKKNTQNTDTTPPAEQVKPVPTVLPSVQPTEDITPTTGTTPKTQGQKASNYLPVKYVAGNPQKIGQTLVLDTPKNVSGITLQGSYGAGTAIKLTLYKLNNPLDVKSGTVVTSKTFDPSVIVKEEMFDVLFTSPVVLEAGSTYFFTVEPGNTLSDAGIGFEEKGTLTNGTMQEYTRLVGGNGETLSQTPSWQIKKAADVVYRLIDLTGTATPQPTGLD